MTIPAASLNSTQFEVPILALTLSLHSKSEAAQIKELEGREENSDQMPFTIPSIVVYWNQCSGDKLFSW